MKKYFTVLSLICDYFMNCHEVMLLVAVECTFSHSSRQHVPGQHLKLPPSSGTSLHPLKSRLNTVHHNLWAGLSHFNQLLSAVCDQKLSLSSAFALEHTPDVYDMGFTKYITAGRYY